MPKNVETQLRRSARKKGLKGKRMNAYVYGTINKIVRRTKARKRRRG
jgi:hypothetical protein